LHTILSSTTLQVKLPISAAGHAGKRLISIKGNVHVPVGGNFSGLKKEKKKLKVNNRKIIKEIMKVLLLFIIGSYFIILL